MMLIANQPEINLGTIKYGQTYEFTFTLVNSGNEDARISRIVRGCSSCTQATIDDPKIKAGGKGDINVKYTPGSTGVTKKQIQVTYETPTDPNAVILLTFKAQVDG